MEHLSPAQHALDIVRQQIYPAALSDKDVLKLVENQAKLVTHEEIPKYRTIEQLMGKHKACIILYVTKVLPGDSMFGHWCCVFKAPWQRGTVSYFDPYGNEPDWCLSKMSREALEKFGNEPALSRLLHNYADRGGVVVYNKAPLQKHARNDAICGRLTGLRLQFRHLNGDQFAKMMNSYNAHGLSSDDLASLMTSFIN